MYCKNCGSEIGKDDKFCANCGYDSVEESQDLDCVTKISTPLFVLFNILTLGIYGYVKWYRMTGDLRKIVPREETVSPLVITSYIFSLHSYHFIRPVERTIDSMLMSGREDLYGIFGMVLFVCFLIMGTFFLLHIHCTYHTLNNIIKVARIKQNKDLKYNKFWAFIFNIVYINFVINTYDQRLVENKK